MSQKVCPICGTPAHPQAQSCSVCGASLDSTPAEDQALGSEHPEQAQAYDFHYGETDLAEHYVRWKGSSYFLAGLLVMAGAACTLVFIVGAMRVRSLVQSVQGTPIPSTTPLAVVTALEPLGTNTAQPTLFLPTVTAPAPATRTPSPTVTITPTEGPCMQTVQSGDSLIALVSRCGHRDLDVIDLVLELNGLDAPEVIQVGQTLEIPWPTPTSAPASEEEAAVDESAASEAQVEDENVASLPESNQVAAFEPTLQAGVAWHTVIKDETIISIAYDYGADVKILSELNPEVTFSQCDFGLFGGGPSCVVNLFEGQRVRVPAPTPTPTLSPTPSGSETATPTITPTFNAPSALSPSNRALFQHDELVTLRWVATGTLAADQVYRVQVVDLTAGQQYSADTTELFFIIPDSWQGQDGARHEFEWSVSVVDLSASDTPLFRTQVRMFTWESVANANA